MPRLSRSLVVAFAVGALFARPAVAGPLDLFTRVAVPTTALTRGEAAPGAVFARLSPDAVTRARADGRATIALPTGDGGITLELERRDVLLPGARLTTTDDAGSHPFAADVVCLSGRVAGDPASTAVLSLGPGGAMGLIESRGRHWAIAPVAGGLHRIADEAALAEPAAAPRCGVDETFALRSGPKPLPRPADRVLTTTTRYVCNLAVDCDYEWWATRWAGNTTNATQYVLTVFAAISLIYERDIGTSIQLGYLNLWTTSSDPYNASPASSQLGEFQTWWSANRQDVNRTIAHLISGRNLNGGVAYINVLCDNVATGFGYGVTSTEGSAVLPSNVTNRDVWLIAHEVGHQFGSPHTQSCFWSDVGYVATGGMLDSCYTAEGPCYAGQTAIIPRDKGTIMSYCDQLPGGSQGNNRLAFHAACRDWMRQQVEARVCMASPDPQPPTQVAASAGTGANHLAWVASGSPDVLHYDVYRSSYQTDPAAALVGSTAATTFDDPAPWSTFYYRVRAVRAGDQSEASGEIAANRCPLLATNSISSGTAPLGLASADFDEDGFADLAVAQNTTGKVAVMRGNGDGTFAAAVTYTVGTAPNGVTTGDFNDDGITDLAVVNSSSNNVSILLGQGAGGVGNGTFGTATNFGASLAASQIVTGDFNEDGITDLAIANVNGLSVTILRGNGTDGVGTGTFSLSATIAGLGTGLKDLRAADINGDGITDLVVLRNAGLRTLIGQGTGGKGNGSFALGSIFIAGTAGGAFAAGDLNADGITDFAVVNNVVATSTPMLAVLLGNGSGGLGNGTFAAPVNSLTSTGAMSAAIADFTGDGKADVAVGINTPENSVLIYPGLGNGQLAGSMRIDVDAPPRTLLAADFDSDGVLDLITSNNSANRLSLVRTACALELANGATVASPNGGEIWIAPSEHTLSWTRDPGCASVNLDLSRDGGVNWERIASNVPGTSYAWTATGPYTNQARLRVSSAFVPSGADLSDANFTLVPENLLDAPAPSAVTALAIRRVVPNPVRGEMTIELALPGAADATLELLDVAGRRVAARNVSPGAGVSRIAWHGPRLAPGVYVLRLEQGGRRVAAKVAVVE